MNDLDKALELAREIIDFCEDCDPENAMDNSPECLSCPDIRPREYYLAEQLLALHDWMSWIPVENPPNDTKIEYFCWGEVWRHKVLSKREMRTCFYNIISKTFIDNNSDDNDWFKPLLYFGIPIPLPPE